MKTLIFIPALAIMCSCNHTNDTTHKHKKTKQIHNMVAVGKTDSLPAKSNFGVEKNDAVKKLIGIWALDKTEKATFEINKNTFYYPEHDAFYKYKIVGDSVRVTYDGFDESFAFKFKDDDNLILTGDDGDQLYHRKK